MEWSRGFGWSGVGWMGVGGVGGGSLVPLILNPELCRTAPFSCPATPHPLPLAPPRSVVAFVIVIWPCLLNASTVYFAL